MELERGRREQQNKEFYLNPFFLWDFTRNFSIHTLLLDLFLLLDPIFPKNRPSLEHGKNNPGLCHKLGAVG